MKKTLFLAFASVLIFISCKPSNYDEMCSDFADICKAYKDLKEQKGYFVETKLATAMEMIDEEDFSDNTKVLAWISTIDEPLGYMASEIDNNMKDLQDKIDVFNSKYTTNKAKKFSKYYMKHGGSISYEEIVEEGRNYEYKEKYAEYMRKGSEMMGL